MDREEIKLRCLEIAGGDIGAAQRAWLFVTGTIEEQAQMAARAGAMMDKLARVRLLTVGQRTDIRSSEILSILDGE